MGLAHLVWAHGDADLRAGHSRCICCVELDHHAIGSSMDRQLGHILARKRLETVARRQCSRIRLARCFHDLGRGDDVCPL